MTALLERAARERPGDIFFTHGDEAVGLDEFNRLVNRMARNLQQAGVTAGVHVAVMMDTGRDYFATWFALAKVGAVEVAINPAYRGELLAHQLRQSASMIAVIDEEYLPNLATAAGEVDDLRTVVVRGDSWSPFEVAGPSRSWSGFDRLLAPQPEDNLGLEVPPDSIGGMVFTSGTTGPSKAVLLSQHYMAAYGLMYAEVNELDESDVILNFQPVFHMTGKFVAIAALAVGGRMHVMSRFRVTGFWDEMRAFGVTNVVAIGGVCNMLLSVPATPDDTDNPVKVVYAVPDLPELHTEFEQRFDCVVTTVFGSSEVGLPIFRSPADVYAPGSAGRRSPHYEVEVVDGFGAILPPGQVGEIVVRGRGPLLLCSGYNGQPEKMLEATRDLWFHTGDRGRFDDEGNMWFVDRATDSLRRRGENISSFELESQIARHPAVAEAVAVSTPSELGEDEVWVLARLREGFSVTPEELLQHCETVLPYFMIPRYIEIVEDFPRTPTAKVQKYKIRAQGPGVATWDREAHGWFIRGRKLVREATERTMP
ncbi:AMP-binding protein [Nocardioides humi]